MMKSPNNTIVRSKVNSLNTFNLQFLLVVDHDITKILHSFLTLQSSFYIYYRRGYGSNII